MTVRPNIESQHHIVDVNAPWLVLGNSLVTDMSIFDAQAAHFSNCFNILRYDQRGHGKSGIGSQTLNFDILADDLLFVLDQFDVAHCTYIGISMGVPTGLAAYAKASKRFDAMVFIDGQACSAPAAAEQWQARIDGAKVSGMQEFARATVPRWLKQDATLEQKIGLEKMIATTSFEGFSACASALKFYDYRSVFAEVICPMLLIAGAEDGGMPNTMQKLADSHPQAQFASVPIAGHVPCFEKPAEVNALILAFLDRNGFIS